jgi:hypothetical protein
MAKCKQCERSAEFRDGVIRTLKVNADGLCAACVCANAEIAAAAREREKLER